MNSQYINPFLTSTIATFEKIFDCRLTRGKPYRKKGSQPEHEIGSMLEFSGEFSGIIILSLSRELALHVTEVLNEERPPEINIEVVDIVCRLMTAILNETKAKLQELKINVSIPPKVVMKYRSVEFPPGTKALCVPFESDWGEVTVEIGIVEPTLNAA